MLNLGITEIILILVVGIVVVGPERLPNVVRWLGRQYGKLMRASDELRRAFVLEADRAEADARSEDLLKRRDEARQRIKDARIATDGSTPQPRDLPKPESDSEPSKEGK
jgi:sec-independent protein translocase protein TatB